MKRVFLFLIFLFAVQQLSAQVLKGIVSDQEGNPIPFSKIWVQNTSYGTIANGKGYYQLEVKKNSTYIIQFSAFGYLNKVDTILIQEQATFHNSTLSISIQELEEVSVGALSKRSRGKEIMKQVIDKRKSFLDATDKYTCNTYCYTSLDKTKKVKNDSVADTVQFSRAKFNITEWYGSSYFKANNKYKDVIIAFKDYTDKVASGVNVTVTFSTDDLGEMEGGVATNPYVFVNGIQDADINIFKNSIDAPALSQRPIISPLSYQAFAYYNFFLESSFYEGGDKIYEIRVEPVFKEEALFYGTIFIKDVAMEPVSYELGINKGALSFFKEMRIICSYSKVEDKLLPSQKEFIYLIKEGSTTINGDIRVSYTNYEFEYDDSKRNFWLESSEYTPEAYNRDTTYWETIRPFHLKNEERQFIHEQDSITTYHQSEGYLLEQDSTYNTLTVWDFLFNGVGFRNTFKKQEFEIGSLLSQVVPFGVGGYRHRLPLTYSKEFKNAHALFVETVVDYGFRNSDLKGSLELGYMYNPRRFSKISIKSGDTYDMINNYESIQGTLGPANRVRNQKLELFHSMELTNGLYLKAGVIYSYRQSITNIGYPEWVSVFGAFSEPKPFNNYSIFMTEIEFAYRIRQKYIFRGNKKIVVGSKWPMLSLTYTKGYPNVFKGESDFDKVEFEINDDIDFKSWGESGVRFTAGTFLRKSNLRIIEHKYFRTSDLFFFSDPIQSMQMLDTSLSTSNTYLQTNFIHHFKGFFLNKVWLLNKLKLEETIGGGVLMIPDLNFNQVEFYVGLERMFRIKKQLFKIGVYAVASDNNFDKAAIRYKIGVNFYDSFRRLWDY